MAAFEGLDFLSFFTAQQRQQILDRAADYEFRAGDVVIAEGSYPGGVWLVGEGVLEARTSRNPDISLGTIGPGSIVGEVSLSQSSKATATVTALERTIAFRLPASMIVALAADDPALATSFWRGVAAVLGKRLLRQSGIAAEAARRAQTASQTPLGLPEEVVAEFALLSGLVDRSEGDESADLDAELDEAILRLDAALGAVVADDPSGETMRAIQEVAVPPMLESAFLTRIWEKPHGYAGDWITIEHTYEMHRASDTRRGRFIDGGILRMKPPTALRNRRHVLSEQIRNASAEGGARIMSLACGPAREVWDVFDESPGAIAEAHLLDIDPTAVAHVTQRAVEVGVDDAVIVHQANLIKLALGRTELDVGGFDLVYSIGLIDYFPDDLVVGLLDLVHQWLAPGGRVILGNFHPRNPGKNIMDLFEWRLIHRTEGDMNRLFNESAFGAPCTDILWEDEQINLFAVGTRE